MYQQLRDLHVLHKPIDPTTAYTLQFVGAGNPAAAPR
jgi:hypothetical protein